MEIKPIKTQKDYRSALKIVSRLVDLDPAPNTPEGDHLDLLGTLVEAWERRHFPIEDPSAIEAIRFRMEQMGLTVGDLTPIFGRPNRAYEVLNGVRPLSIGMIRKLHSDLHIPFAALLKEPAKR
jgi:HTH-type transcriptional regulator / antitoxin HigA